MANVEMTGRVAPRPEMRWEPVTDRRGRTHMEARWIVPGQVAITDDAA